MRHTLPCGWAMAMSGAQMKLAPAASTTLRRTFIFVLVLRWRICRKRLLVK